MVARFFYAHENNLQEGLSNPFWRLFMQIPVELSHIPFGGYNKSVEARMSEGKCGTYYEQKH